MSTNHASIGIAVSLLLSASSVHAADTFRCGQHLIREGMATTTIKRRCGEPQSIERYQEPIVASHANGTDFEIGVKTKELWTYDREWGQFPVRLTVENGVATKIELLTGGQL